MPSTVPSLRRMQLFTPVGGDGSTGLHVPPACAPKAIKRVNTVRTKDSIGVFKENLSVGQVKRPRPLSFKMWPWNVAMRLCFMSEKQQSAMPLICFKWPIHATLQAVSSRADQAQCSLLRDRHKSLMLARSADFRSHYGLQDQLQKRSLQKYDGEL